MAGNILPSDTPRSTHVTPESRMLEARPRTVVSATPAAAPPGFNLDDAYYILFRHKWKIVICTMVGLLAAGGAYLFLKPAYQSNAKLFVRYVIMEGKPVRPNGEDSIKSPDMRGETIISSEQEMLTSLDLARNVAQAIGPEKILARIDGGNDLTKASIVISNGMTAAAAKYSSVIALGFKHPDPEVAQLVLRQIIEQYFKMHLEVHRSAGMVGDYLAQETDQLRSRLAQTEDELRKARAKAGVISVEETKRSYAAQIDAIRQQIFTAQAEQAQRGSVLKQLSKAQPGAKPIPTNDAPTEVNTEPPVPPTVLIEYRALLGRFEFLRRTEQELMAVYTPENSRVQQVRNQLADTENQKQKLETQNPALLRPTSTPKATTTASTPASAAGRNFDFAFEAAQLNAIEARIATLNAQMEALRKEGAALDQVEGTIQELMRKKELEESNYRRYAASLEQSRINDALGSGKVSNISVIQTPSPPYPDSKKTMKVVGGLAAAGLVIGLAWACLIEFVFDRSIRRVTDFARFLKLPLFLSIPISRKQRRLFRKKTGERNNGASNGNGGTLLVTASLEGETAAAIYPYHETLRDRLIGYFESRGLTQKPKLVAVTGLGPNVGVTTTAAGLARCLSETGDGNVLLVDLTPGQGSAQHFQRGKPTCGLEEMLETRDSAQVQDRLFVVADISSADKLSRLLPQRFSKLLPQLKSSDFDYIIFDMPPVSQISITTRLAGFMDMVLLVVESERSSRESVGRATTLLAETRAHVGAILNKTRTYVPKWLHQECVAP